MVIAPSGEVDVTTQPLLQAELKKLQAEKPRKLIVNLAEVPYMDSSGVATLVQAMQSSRKQGNALVMCNLQERVKNIFHIAKLDSFFTVVVTLEDALAR
mgnify:CR=1 FL=1